MASAPITKRMKGEATCAICLQLMSEPMSISCGHSYCTLCIISFLENLGHAEPSPNMFPCPHCRASFQLSSLRPVSNWEVSLKPSRRWNVKCHVRNTESTSISSAKTRASSYAGAVSGHRGTRGTTQLSSKTYPKITR